MGKSKWRYLNDKWNTIVNRQSYRKEKVFRNREASLRNTTSFFISNLPDACDKAMLRNAFAHLDNLEDAFVPAKKDRLGNRFGFIKLSNVSDPGWWAEKLKEIRIEGAVLGVNLARFNRDGSKAEANANGHHASVFSRIQGLNNAPVKGKIAMTKVPIQNRLYDPKDPGRFGYKSFSSVVTGGKDSRSNYIIALPPMNTESKKILEFKSLVGEVKDIDILNELTTHLSGISEEEIRLKYLGGLKVLLCFNNPKEAEEFRWNKVNDWEKWFSRLYIWEGIPPIFERVAWVKVLGVPACLWDRHVFNKIGERCGRLLVKSDAEVSNGNFAEERLAILVNSGSRFSAEFDLSWKDQTIKIWVEEISGQWSPAFLDEDAAIPDPSDSSSESSSEFGEAPVAGDSGCSSSEVGESDQSKSQHLRVPSTCMGSPNDRSHIFEESFAAHGASGMNEEKTNDVINDLERESVGHPAGGGEIENNFFIINNNIGINNNISNSDHLNEMGQHEMTGPNEEVFGPNSVMKGPPDMGFSFVDDRVDGEREWEKY
ncbi:putative RNA recognition motif domain, nucleotide-binding alpha-beta plait domain superfamily [Helianthus annuus]|nr:putative RNA recognition motif domain, nucleotide-binding alpha-beta plait domain superfamily [Helianthus annuus]KAJ0820583.1 putative RNA recognition motif domain, nucleotide-binding alpha-beta plait domain superfamily [Helianthus annuus]